MGFSLGGLCKAAVTVGAAYCTGGASLAATAALKEGGKMLASKEGAPASQQQVAQNSPALGNALAGNNGKTVQMDIPVNALAQVGQVLQQMG